MPNAEHKLIYEFSGSRNLNTNPLDVTGLDGDSWDYMVELECEVSPEVNTPFFYANLDTASNYRWYQMRGNESSAGADVFDSYPGVRLNTLFNTATKTATRMFIRGDSSGERYFDIFFGTNNNTTSTIHKTSFYWKNTVDNLTSLRFKTVDVQSGNYDITLRIYQVPKQANLENYDLVDVKNWSAESATKSFTGLQGDTDKEYMIVWKSTGSANVRINNLSTSIYTEQDFKNSSGTLSASNVTSTSYVDALYYDGELHLQAESGRKRLFTGTTAKTVSSQQAETGCCVNNTADEVTQIDIIPTGTITAEAYLYRRKSNRTIDPVPMRTVKVIDVAGNFSSGQTVSNIQGNRIDGAIKLEYTGVGNADIEVQFNTITTNSNQQLKGSSSSATASSTSPTKIKLCGGSSDTTNTNKGVLWIYPKSGQNRPCLNEQAYNSNTLEKNAVWINDDTNEIISMTFTASNTNTMDGKIVCSIPKNTKQASPSWT